MDLKKTNSPLTTVTRDLDQVDGQTGNVYESLIIISKRANEISVALKNELNSKLQDFATYTDNLEEIFENREQIEISKYYERMPKPTLIAIQEYIDRKLVFTRPAVVVEEVVPRRRIIEG